MPLAKPGQERRIARDPLLHVQAGGRQDDDVGALDVVSSIGPHPQGAQAGHASSVDRSDAHTEARVLSFAVQQVPQQAGGVKDLDWSMAVDA